MSENEAIFDCYAILEVFGHQKLAGRVSEQVVAGTGFIRIDVPAIDGRAAFTRLYGPAAICSITPVSEETARRAAQAMRVEPVTVYMPALPAPSGGPDWDSSYESYTEEDDDDEPPF